MNTKLSMIKTLVTIGFVSSTIFANDSDVISKGDWMVSGQFHHTRHSSEYSDKTSYTTELGIRPTYFITKNIGLGLGLLTSLYRSETSNSETYHYYPELILTTSLELPYFGKLVNPYIGVGGLFERRYSWFGSWPQDTFIPKTGVMIFVNQYVALSPEWSLEYKRYKSGEVGPVYNDYKSNISLSVRVFW